MSTMLRWLADEHFPMPAFTRLVDAGLDIRHVAIEQWGLSDTAVMQMAIDQQRIVITFDGDHGTLVFKDGYRPIGIVYFRIDDYLPETPAYILLDLLASNLVFIGYITVVEKEMIRQRVIPNT
ncbi:hypothetical protein CLV58_1028 [Spirosoma oryzae]|uniref:DUF5615 domain-containing protein n=2 Tax=Spirosoma oryzae TaxID=1469603 RepID=A0A2T0THS7_9BACT|nr:hypothetical protein CLV58_1028 [Spirosoma oryzae]